MISKKVGRKTEEVNEDPIDQENISEYFPDEENSAEDQEDYQDLSEEKSDTADQIEGIDSLLASPGGVKRVLGFSGSESGFSLNVKPDF